MKQIQLIFLLISGMITAFGQDTLPGSSFQQFFYPDGTVSSEGTIRNGLPDGYWKAYHENGMIKSEGNRRDHKLEGIWRFYDQGGKPVLEITYRDGKKNGIRTSWLDREIVRECFIDDVKEGLTEYFHAGGRKRQDIPYVKGLEQGIGKEYNESGEIITMTEYKKGFIVERVKINRKDKFGRRQGKWISFWENGRIRLEGVYKDDKENGYFKEYNESGGLLKISKFTDGVLQTEAAEVRKLEVEKEYYPDGAVRAARLYRNGVLEGITVEYSPEGSIVSATEYLGGMKIGEGLVLDDGSRNGPWKEYYPGGDVKAEGNYSADNRTGKWNFYYSNGRLEQTGVYNNNGKPEGTWKWYYDSGQLLREENYFKGRKDGLSEEFNEEGNLTERGEYINGLEDGPWFQQTDSFYQRGSYRDGMRTGEWLVYDLQPGVKGTDSLLMFKGSFQEDLPDGKHTYYWDNGKIRDEGMFVMGKKEGEWITYNYDGSLFMIVTFSDGTETRYDGVKIKPPFEAEE